MHYEKDEQVKEATTYTHTRIRKEYLDKLQALAAGHKRSAMRELEVLIDEARVALSPQPEPKPASRTDASPGTPNHE